MSAFLRLPLTLDTGTEVEVGQHMVRLERGWACGLCGYTSASTAAKVDVKRHIKRQHYGLTGR